MDKTSEEKVDFYHDCSSAAIGYAGEFVAKLITGTLGAVEAKDRKKAVLMILDELREQIKVQAFEFVDRMNAMEDRR